MSSSPGPNDLHEDISSRVESSLDGLTAPSGPTSPKVVASQVVSAGAEYVNRLSAQLQGQAARADPDADPYYPYDTDSTPGVSHYFWVLWTTVLDKVYDSPTSADAHQEHISRVVEFVGNLKASRQPDDQEWILYNQKVEWQELPVLGRSVRDVYNGPFDLMKHDPSTLVSTEVQSAIACPYEGDLSPQSLADDASRLAADRHRWLSLQTFISRLWRDCACDSYALYAIWAIRPALEDWPATPPSFKEPPDSFENSPAYLAFQVEAAAIWILNTAPLMYSCTEIWGKNGNLDWPDNAGTPGRGGRRWDGVDGYDTEHKRWQLWKQVLKEVVEWCDAESRHMQGWKVKEAAVKSLEAMDDAERA